MEGLEQLRGQVVLEGAEEFEILLEVAEMVGQDFRDEAADGIPASGIGADEEAGFDLHLEVAIGIGGRGSEGGEEAGGGMGWCELGREWPDCGAGLANAAARLEAVVLYGRGGLFDGNANQFVVGRGPGASRCQTS